ncbi:MAG: hypothetical protein N4A76_04410 [Firmicutes bacterium]|jgi:hypothetical protein|nr:hypothetical protein [Bacillota bacterium]
MSERTSNLGLLKKDPSAEGSDRFRIKELLNDNWDIIDEIVQEVKQVTESNSNQRHNHTNKEILDDISVSDVDSWNKSFNSLNYGHKVIKSESFKISISEINSVVNLVGDENIVVTISADSEIPVGTQIAFITLNDQSISFIPEEGCILYSKDNYRKLDGKYSSASLIKNDVNTWVLVGGLKE